MSRYLASVLFALLALTSSFAASIESQNRRLITIVGRLGDYDQDLQTRISAATGRFDQTLAATAAVNGGDASAQSDQQSTINAANLGFSGTGDAVARSHAVLNEAEPDSVTVESRSINDLEIVFRLNKPGKVRLSAVLAAGRSGTGDASAAVAIFQADTFALLWSSVVSDNTVSFNQDVPLKKGRYRLRIALNTSTAAIANRDNSSTASASFGVRGQILEN